MFFEHFSSAQKTVIFSNWLNKYSRYCNAHLPFSTRLDIYTNHLLNLTVFRTQPLDHCSLNVQVHTM